MNAPSAATTSMTTVDLTPRIGTEVRADIETLLSGRFAAELRQVLEQRGVLVFRELNLTHDQQLAFTETLGELMPQSGKPAMNVSLDKADHEGGQVLAEYLFGTFYWHIDRTDQDVPPLASLLTARRTSASGGATEFANTYAAWEELPEADKAAYQNLRVVHSVEVSQLYVRPEPSLEELIHARKYPAKIHPLVWTHRSGRKSLVLGSTASHVAGMSLDQGRYVLTKLREWATQPRFVYRHEWTVGDLVIWDNTGVMHRVEPYAADSGRLMVRTSLRGEEPLA